VIASVINECYLTKQKMTGEAVILEVDKRCRTAKLKKPCAETVRARLRAIPPRVKVLKREGRKAAHDKFGAVRGSFPGADSPLAVVQIDHTLLDIIVLDEEMRLPIGRPWLTLAIDVFSRMVVGYHLSLDYPSAFAVGLCLCHGMLDKSAELEQLGIQGEWPVWGKPRMIHSDNGKDFRSYLIQETLDEYDVRYEFRPPKTPHYGGHIERLAGTLGKKIHALPGTTFSNPKQRGEYKSEAKARMTLRELRLWLVQMIVGVYHNKVHDGVGCPPLAKWNEGIVGSDRVRGRGLPDPIDNPRRLRLDFLPFITRTMQPEGIVWDKIWYRDPLLSQWVRAGEGHRRRKFKVRRDPTDISKLYFFDPILNNYVEIPYRDYGRPSISLWDYRAAVTWLRRQGRGSTCCLSASRPGVGSSWSRSSIQISLAFPPAAVKGDSSAHQRPKAICRHPLMAPLPTRPGSIRRCPRSYPPTRQHRTPILPLQSQNPQTRSRQILSRAPMASPSLTSRVATG